MRIGHGYDVHRFKIGRRLVLGGVEIPYTEGLDGHSDADVVIHALMDALLGAAALGDIGMYFPPGDPQFKGADSMDLLDRVLELITAANYKIGNVDITIIAQQPKLYNFIPDMQENIARALKVDIRNVNLKATTEEGLGFTGACLGIAAHAVALLKEKGGFRFL
ncbi:MAG: 2-C-methyl-D-erythritol 2,4-cyclodiphosphate synthase [Clostridiales bacterium]|nr:2-C-methyl-D-erythritol 2,4-cyclodiphosphate synthase [Clostridiales bacterium]